MPALPHRRTSVLLELDLTQPLPTSEPPDALGRLAARGRPHLAPILRTLHQAGGDHRVAGLIVKLGGDPPHATAAELRLGLAAFVASGKPTTAWAEDLSGSGSTAALGLGATADEIWLQPGATVGPLGVAVETTFVRQALDRLGIETQIGQRHEFKNAADVLARTSYSDAHREAVDQIVRSVLDDAVAVIATGRGLTPDRVRELVDAGVMSAEQAQTAGLVDELGYRDQAYAAIRERIGEPVDLLLAERWRPKRTAPAVTGRARRHVALVEVHGAITSGRSRSTPWGRTAGSDTVGAALRAAARSEQVGAVLMRIDSPGGSAVASETIWREVVRTQESGTPVVVSMGALAASGGYYVACSADTILALPSTLTGSIGVLGGKLVATGLLDQLGITTDRVSHGTHALMNSARQRYTDAEQGLLDAELDRIYADFVAKVAAGRRLPLAEVERIARGRVWTGADAVRLGLVDQLGGRPAALRIAQQRAELPDSAGLRPALHVPLLRRFGRPRNTDDPRVSLPAGMPGLGLGSGLGTELARAARVRGAVGGGTDLRLRP